MYDTVIKLVSKTDTGETDEYGDAVYCDDVKEVFAETVSVGRTEFYQAQTAGYKPEIVFKLADYMDYENQPEVICDGIRYKVLRTYRKGNELQITCYGGVRDERAEVCY